MGRRGLASDAIYYMARLHSGGDTPPHYSTVERPALPPIDILDVLVLQDDGTPWDFDLPINSIRPIQLLKRERPRLLVGSPVCTYFSQLMKRCRARMEPEQFERCFKTFVIHLELACCVYRVQIALGAKSVLSHMCQLEMYAKAEDGTQQLVKKPNRWMLSSTHILRELALTCQGDHRHTLCLRTRQGCGDIPGTAARRGVARRQEGNR